MEEIKSKRPNRAGLRILLIVFAIIVLVIIIGMPSLRDSIINRVSSQFRKPEVTETAAPPSERVEKKVEQITQEKMPEKELRTEVGKTLDHVVNREEPFQVKETKLSIGEIFRSQSTQEVAVDIYYGVKLVEEGDSIWGIHYDIMREFFQNEGVELPPRADQPNSRGYSSGLGKILKYDEKKAYVYNIATKRLRSGDINVIYPGEEIVFFSMKDLFSHLRGKDLSFLDHLYFDGQHLYIVHPDGSKELLTQG